MRLLSTLILAPVAISASMIRSGASLGHAVVSQLARIPSAVMEETFEELYLDPLIENFIKTHVDLAGGTDELGNFLSLIATSMREGLGGLGKFVSGRFSMDVSQSGLLQLSAFYGDRQYDDGTQQAPSHQPNPAFSAVTTSFIATASGSGMFGFGLLLGLASVGLDAYLESSAFNIHLNAFMELFSGSQQQLLYSLDMDLATALAYQQTEISLDSLTPSEAQQQPLFPNKLPLTVHNLLDIQNLIKMRMEFTDLIMKLKRQNIEKNIMEIENLKSSAEERNIQ